MNAARLLLAATIVFAIPAWAQSDWKKPLEASLKAEYPITGVGIQMLTFDYNRITAPGGVFVVRIPGIYADVADTKQAIVRTTITAGAAQQQRGFLASLSNNAQARSLKTGESVYILREKVKDDGIDFELLTQETTDHDGHQQRYRSVVSFPFQKSELSTLKLEDIKKSIDPVFASASVANATESKSIALGMSPEAVKAALGNPDKIVSLGAKQIFVYKDMKVVFQNNAVADVQ